MAEKHCPKFVELSPREAQLSKLFTGRDETVKVAPEGWTYLKAMKKHISDYKNFEFQDTDVIVDSFPKSGTTWVQELVWTMRNNANLDNPMANMPISIRSPNLGDEAIVDHFMEKQPEVVKNFCAMFPDYDESCGMMLHSVKASPRPRTIKSHLPFCLLSPTILEKGKVVYVIRDPRDVCISYHHHCRLFVYEKYQGTFDQFIDAFIESAVLLGPYWAHVDQAWLLRDHPNMHIVFYEKMKSKPEEEMLKLNGFLETNLTDKQMEKILEFTSFVEMKKRGYHAETFKNVHLHLDMNVAKEGGFFRKGLAGNWREVLTKDQKDKFADWIENNCHHKGILENIISA